MTANKSEENAIQILEERINALETRNLFQDDVIEQLSAELTVHQTQISELREQIQLVANRLKDSGALNSGKEEIEPPPPHY
ncbi:SlyX family protein [Colwellia sp. 1_MG-2023]|jgi:SlyX protein|uniref:SlyX family protein n=1 Tax=unclassified Colwellia TaxID=196834 RepID=UPI001C0A3054|nr:MULTISPECIES: SlyX family protein [unclassified Colwellia]MBU2925160.1 SlyX family protein [Colwellia sp. C2M11]MDO6488178.1 SlyX family protein [Colwellia sp. 6_MG-2023]MDO6653343.1 SlyX family protein [Colwellia sp. 3_MG-2023]MDO6666127.1 SlyX family protein [Colwellia sp. 2_MG-2023]MDO6690500.1 SlyX family protein [Colwellia sp. 1_MG-2023]